MTARGIATALASRLPPHSFRDGVWTALDGAEDRESGRCPRCGRALPRGSVGPAFGYGAMGAIGFPHTPQELAAACLVDGPRSRNALDLTLDDLVDATQDLAAALRDKGWRHWATAVDRVLSEPTTDADRAEAVGQTLELMRRAGPRALRNAPELESLVTSLGRYWPGAPNPT
jgi:hypothetical protein